MAILKEKQVEIPPKAFVQTKNNNKYVYVYTDFYRNDDNKTRNRSLCIGKQISNTQLMNPNNNYYSYFGIQKEFEECQVFKVGFSALVEQCFSETGLDKILISVFGEDLTQSIKIISSYIVQGGISMSYVDDFMEEHFFDNNCRLITSKRASEIFVKIMDTGLDLFFSKWIKKTVKKDYICYDVTSVSTHSDWITHAEYGYNRDHEDLKQINIGLFTVEATKIPVYYENYNGSLTDKTNLLSVIKNAKTKGIKRIKLVMDGGFFDSERLLGLVKSNLIFTIGMPGNLNESKKLINEHGSDLYKSAFSTDYPDTFGKIIDYEIFGIQGKVFIGMDTNARNLKLGDLRSKIARYENELKHSRKMYSTIIKEKKYTELFSIKEKENSKGFTFELDKEKEEQLSCNYGYFLVFSTDLKSTANNIIYYYREKDVDEKMFYALKNYNDLDRLRTHQQKTTDGKVFVAFISLILRSWLNEKLYEYKKRTRLTLKKIINKVGDIQILHSKKETRYLKSLTKEQKEILAIFGLNADDLEKKVKKKLR